MKKRALGTNRGCRAPINVKLDGSNPCDVPHQKTLTKTIQNYKIRLCLIIFVFFSGCLFGDVLFHGGIQRSLLHNGVPAPRHRGGPAGNDHPRKGIRSPAVHHAASRRGRAPVPHCGFDGRRSHYRHRGVGGWSRRGSSRRSSSWQQQQQQQQP